MWLADKTLTFGAVAAAITVLAAWSAAAALTVRHAPPVDPSEAFPGGAATSRASVDNTNAFSASSANMPFERELDFKIGNAVFRRFWVQAPSSTKTSDGLGPLYNARSCQGCHLKDGRGMPPKANWPDDDAVSMFLRLSIPPQTDEQKELLAAHKINAVPEPTYGGQLQNFAIAGLDNEGRMHITYKDVPVSLAGGETVTLRNPSYSIADPGYGPLHPETMMSPRVAPPMIGLGLLELIPEADILAGADPDDANGDGISGRASQVWSRAEDKVRLGRFGWKAGAPSLAQQAAEAFAGDIGMATSMMKKPSGDCTAAQTACMNAPDGAPPNVPGVEIGDDLFKLVRFYSANLAVPPRRDAGKPGVLKGRELFHASGCASCHRPSFKTGEDPDATHLSHQTIWPYTDLLLHDMGEGLADNRPEGVATGQEWRTAPLWGIGLTHVVSGHTQLLHDGRARNVTEAILWHGGEAQAARDAFAGLSKEDRDALVAFVNSL